MRSRLSYSRQAEFRRSYEADHDTEIIAKQKRINRDSTRIEQLNDTLPKVKRKGFVKGFLIGFGSGAAAKQGVDILTQIK